MSGHRFLVIMISATLAGGCASGAGSGFVGRLALGAESLDQFADPARGDALGSGHLALLASLEHDRGDDQASLRHAGVWPGAGFLCLETCVAYVLKHNTPTSVSPSPRCTSTQVALTLAVRLAQFSSWSALISRLGKVR
jgi:hypothetical protein